MIQILVRLEVIDREYLNQFESCAVSIMKKHQGRLLTAFEIADSKNGKLEEIHVLEFPDEGHFTNYRNDEKLASLSELRKKAVSHTEVRISTGLKSY